MNGRFLFLFLAAWSFAQVAFGGTLLRQSFESADWTNRSVSITGTGVTGSAAYGAYGTIDTPTDVVNNGTDAPSKGLLFTVNSGSASGAWKAGLSSGVLTLTTANTAVTNLGLITLSFSLRASKANPVVVRLESYDAAGTTRTGGLSRLIYPATPNYYQRFALDLSTFAADGAGTFVPTATKIVVTYELNSTAGGDGWPAANGLTLKIDNFNYATPAYYVATNGVDSTSGGRGTTVGLPFLTANYAMSFAQAGDIIVVRGGTYNSGISFRKYISSTQSYVLVIGAPDAWVVLRSYPGEVPIIRGKAYSTITFGLNNYTGPASAYLEIRGMTARGYSTADVNGDRDLDPTVASPSLLAVLGTGGEANCNGISADGRTMTNLMHDIRIADNTTEYETGAGIGIIRVDRVMIENNISRYNSWWTGYGTSGFSILVPTDYENNGDYRQVVQNNQSYGNETMAPAVGNDLRFTDGNGIIIDVNRNSDVGSSPDPAYRGRTLVQNNLVYNNGGSGIHAFNAQNVEIVHNTAYLNSASPRLEYGQIFAGYAKNVTIKNNVLVAPDNISGDSTRNEPYIGNGSQNVSGTILYQNNIYYGLGHNIVVPAGHTLTPTANFNPNITADPLLSAPSRSPATANFRLRSASPAINYGPTLAYRSGVDLTGRSRPLSAAATDAGAYQTQSNATFVPVLSPPPANYGAAQSVTITGDTAGAKFIYTTNGSTPTVDAGGNATNGTVYSTPISVSAATTLLAIAWKSGLTTSDVSGGSYTFINSTTVQIPDLLFYPPAGNYSDSTLTGIICRTPGALVRYTTDGTTPTTTNGTLATAAMVNMTSYATLKAIAYLPGRPNSNVKSGLFNITGSFGHASAGSTVETLGANTVRFSSFTATDSITLASVYARLSGAGTYRVALYADSSGVPGTLLATSNALTNPPAGWNTFSFSTRYAVTADTVYWLAIWTNNAASQIYTDTSGGTVRQLSSTLGGNGTWPTTAGTTTASANGGFAFSLYATPPNVAPTATPVNSNIAITLPANASLGAVVTDDNRPNIPGSTTAVWSKVSGPGTVTFANSASVATTATFSLPGNYVVQLVATDGELLSAPASVAVTVYDSYAAWATRYGVGAPDADDDGDGISNLLEYAAGTNATSAASFGRPQASINPGTGYLNLTFNRIADPTLTYKVEGTSDLVNWTNVWTSTGAQNVAGYVTVSDQPPANANGRFLRLRVSNP